MKGTVKTFIARKEFGFIRGEDGNSYHFFLSDFKPEDHNQVREGAPVNFSESANARGYKAKKCGVMDDSELNCIATPNEFLILKRGQDLRQWDVLNQEHYIISTDSHRSIQGAKRELEYLTKGVGANAIIKAIYHCTEKRSGNYYYSVHSYSGIPVFAGKRSFSGEASPSDVTYFEQMADKAVDKLDKRYKKANKFSKASFMVAVASLFMACIDGLSDKASVMFFFFMIACLIVGTVSRWFIPTKWIQKVGS
ncbi:cold shock domain-containing protein [Vibrio sp.]|nr:cold shock domain-containing protein [Vibrio sp.]